MRHVAVIIHRIGPYHRARLDAAASRMRITAIELSATSDTYAWDPVPNSEKWERRTLSGTDGIAEIERALEELRPDAVAFPAWSRPEGLGALGWCVKRGVPAIVLWESQAHDEARSPWTDFIKRRILKHVSAALTGGSMQAAYLRKLGFDSERIHLGYDVVDNAYFSSSAEVVKFEDTDIRMSNRLPQSYLLCVCRFVPKKNLPTLIRAYSLFRAEHPDSPVHLVLCGDGPERAPLEALVARLELADWVGFIGFRQITRLPGIYALADAFVLVSTTEPWGLVVNEAMACGLPVVVSRRAGCAAELVQEGPNGNGFLVDPESAEEIASKLGRLARDASLRAKMGKRSREIIAEWPVSRFADGLTGATETALARPRAASAIGATWMRGLAEQMAARR